MELTRRHIVAGGASSCALTMASPTWARKVAPRSPGLDAIARTRGFRFGSAIAWAPPGRDGASFSNPRYAALLRSDCGLLVPENELKWQATRPAVDRFAFERMDAIADYASRAGMRLRGHTLLWHYTRWFPRWLNDYDFGANPVAEAQRVLGGHIRTVTQRYGTRIYSYDVVNEAVDPDTAALRRTSLSRAFGSEEAMLDFAFRAAREGAPHAELVYNDYMSWEDGNEKHRAGVLRLLESFRKRGTPVDTLGVQSHIGVFADTSSVAALASRLTPAWRRFLDEVTAMGYRLAITEFDVRDRGLPAAVPARDQAVADFARAYLDVTLSYPQLIDVLAWGMSDRYSWLRGFEPRPDGQVTRGCPYDMDLRPKPLRAALAAAFAAAPVRAAGPRA